MMPPAVPSLEAFLGEPAEAIVELGSPWATSTQSELVTLASGRQVVVQRPRGGASARVTIRRRLRLGRLLPTVAPWLPVPEVLAGVTAGPQPFLVGRDTQRVGCEAAARARLGGRRWRMIGGCEAAGGGSHSIVSATSKTCPSTIRHARTLSAPVTASASAALNETSR